MPNGGFRDPDKNWTWVGQADKNGGSERKKENKTEILKYIFWAHSC